MRTLEINEIYPLELSGLINKKADIVFFALPRWDQPISSPALSLAKEFARTNRVFYIEHPYSLKDVITEWATPEVKKRRRAILRKKDIYTNPASFPENLTIVAPPVTLPVNFLPPGGMYDFFSGVNDRRIFGTIRRILQDYGVKEWVYINSFDPFFARDFPADLKPLVKVYQCMDDISEVGYSKRHGARLEEDITRKFDITLCTSRELTRINSEFTPHSYFHPNAADVSLFRKALENDLPRPPEMAHINGKTIGFTGSLEYRTDYELIEKLARHHSDKHLVFVGPVRTDEMDKRGIAALPNVTMVGPKQITELPGYLKYMDVVIIPFLKNKLTRSIYPLKINEYLGAGKPVVATDFSEDIMEFADVAHIAGDHDTFIGMIDAAIAGDSPEKRAERLARAEQNTWTARVQQFWDYVDGWHQKERPE